MKSLEEGEAVQYQFTWPLEEAGQEGSTVSLAFVVMLREGGFLLALPIGYLPLEVLQVSSSSDVTTIFGPHTTLQVPAVREDGLAVPAGLELGVLVIDAGIEAAVGLQVLGLDGVSVAFHEDPAFLPDPNLLLRLTKAWISSQTSARTDFYSAAEEAVPETPLVEEEEGTEKEEEQGPLVFNPKAKGVPAKPKRVTMAALADQLGSVAQMLPAMVQGLDSMQLDQDALREAVAGQKHVVPPRPSQQPVSSTLQDFAKMMGTPPRVKQVAAVPQLARPLTPQMDSFAGAGRGGGDARGVHLGPRSLGAEQGLDFIGGAVADWWRSLAGLSRKHIGSVFRIKGIHGQNAAADRAIEQVWSLFLASHSECHSEDKAFISSACRPCRCLLDGLQHGQLLGKIRWLRRLSRDGVGSVLPCPHFRCSIAERYGRCERASGIDYDCSGTSGAGQQPVGSGIPVDSSGRSAKSTVGLSRRREPESQVESICSSLLPTLGNGGLGLHERGGLHPSSSPRFEQEEGAASSPKHAFPKEERWKEPKRKVWGRRSRCLDGDKSPLPGSSPSAQLSPSGDGSAMVGRGRVIPEGRIPVPSRE